MILNIYGCCVSRWKRNKICHDSQVLPSSTIAKKLKNVEILLQCGMKINALALAVRGELAKSVIAMPLFPRSCVPWGAKVTWLEQGATLAVTQAFQPRWTNLFCNAKCVSIQHEYVRSD